MKNLIKNTLILICFLVVFQSQISAQKPYRIGTTVANFLELGYGNMGIAMGDATVSQVADVSSIYWNTAGLGYLNGTEFQVMYQPLFVDINTSMAAVGYQLGDIGTFGLGLFMINYGEEDVTSLTLQEGTGEKFDGADMSINLAFGKRLAEWFAFGIGVKYVSSSIWHESASAFAIDLGAIVNTKFLAWTENPGDGLNIGMSISNYGTKLTYNGIDLKQSVDLHPDEKGNFEFVPARYELDSWELPLIFRIGVSFHPLILENQKFTIAVDALHPNNNSESLNAGGQYSFTIPGYGALNLRAGYKGLLLKDTEYGLTVGFGVHINYLNNQILKVDYAYRKFGLLGNVHSYSVGIAF